MKREQFRRDHDPLRHEHNWHLTLNPAPHSWRIYHESKDVYAVPYARSLYMRGSHSMFRMDTRDAERWQCPNIGLYVPWQTDQLSKIYERQWEPLPKLFWQELLAKLGYFAPANIDGVVTNLSILTEGVMCRLIFTWPEAIDPRSMTACLRRACSGIPHVAQKSAGKIAYTETCERGKRDIQTIIKPGRWISRHFGNFLDPVEIAELAQLYARETGSLAKWELRFTTDAEQIEKVYTQGPSSCMSGNPDRFSCDPIHPASAYGDVPNSDLAIAYYCNEDESRITARCVVNTARQAYVTPYGNVELIEEKLEEAGYQHDPEALEGCLIRAIKVHDHSGCKDYAVPYVDGEARFVEPAEYEDGKVCNGATKYFRLGYDGVCADSTSGVISMIRIVAHCANCDESIREDEESHEDSEGDPICDYCYSEYFFTCELTDEIYHRDYMQQVITHYSGGYAQWADWCDDAVSDHAQVCDDCEELHSNELMDYDEESEQHLCTQCQAALDERREDEKQAELELEDSE